MGPYFFFRILLSTSFGQAVFTEFGVSGTPIVPYRFAVVVVQMKGWQKLTEMMCQIRRTTANNIGNSLRPIPGPSASLRDSCNTCTMRVCVCVCMWVGVGVLCVRVVCVRVWCLLFGGPQNGWVSSEHYRTVGTKPQTRRTHFFAVPT